MIALLSANWDEIHQLKNDIESTDAACGSELDYKIGELRGKEVVLAVTGVGIKRARAATSLVIQQFKPGLIINGGFSGALSPELRVGDVIVGSSVTSLKKNEDRLLHDDFSIPVGEFTRGKLLTESRFINDPDEKKRLYESTGALVVDMETWGVVEAVQQSKTPVASVRVVSDEARERLPDMGAIYSSNGELDSKKAEAYFRAYPELLPPYLKFRFTNTPRAQESLCTILSHIVSSL